MVVSTHSSCRPSHDSCRSPSHTTQADHRTHADHRLMRIDGVLPYASMTDSQPSLLTLRGAPVNRACIDELRRVAKVHPEVREQANWLWDIMYSLDDEKRAKYCKLHHPAVSFEPLQDRTDSSHLTLSQLREGRADPSLLFPRTRSVGFEPCHDRSDAIRGYTHHSCVRIY